MAVWLVRAGKRGEREEYALESRVAAIGWSDAGDLSQIETREKLIERLQSSFPDAKHKTILNWASQVWPFRQGIQPGDVVAMPLKNRPFIAFGKVTGGYRFDPSAPWDAQNQIPVQWLREVPRDGIAQDLRYSLGAFMTVCRIWRNDAEKRLKALIEGGPVTETEATSPGAIEETEAPLDLEEEVNEQIRGLIYAKFKGHGLSRLVAAVLATQGYRSSISPEGADGGVDVVAGTGPLGFEGPRLVVQVKSEQSPIDVKVVRELQGVMKQFGAEHGLIVAWGGFKGSVIRETARQFFEIRLWTGEDLIQAVLAAYDRLPDDIRAELPLKRIWVPVIDIE